MEALGRCVCQQHFQPVNDKSSANLRQAARKHSVRHERSVSMPRW